MKYLTLLSPGLRNFLRKQYLSMLVSKSQYLNQLGSHSLYRKYLSFNLKKAITGTKCDLSFDREKSPANLVLLTSITLFINSQKLQFLIIVAGKKVTNCNQEQQHQQQFLLGGYKLKYCEFQFFFSKNLQCNYTSIKDQIFYKPRNI